MHKKLTVFWAVFFLVIGVDGCRHRVTREISRRSAIDQPRGIAVSEAGDIYFAAQGQNQVLEITRSGKLLVVAGNGSMGFGGAGGPALNASLASPADVALDGKGDLYIADTGNNRIRRVNLRSGLITTVAGDGQLGGPDGVAATRSGLWRPVAIAFGPYGNWFVAESTFEMVREVNGYTGIISTIAGFPTAGLAQDGSQAAERDGPSLGGVYGIAADTNGNLYFADARNNRVCMVDRSQGVLSVLAGNSIAGFGGDGAVAPGSSLSFPEGVALDKEGDVFVADTGNNRIRRIDSKTGIITTVAGKGTAGFGGDGQAATQASLSGPTAVAVDSKGNLFIADTGSNCIRRVDAKTGVITTIAGRTD